MPKYSVTYAKLPNEILENPQISCQEKVLYALIVKYSGTNGCCWASQKRFSEHMDIGERQVRNIMKKLKRRGLIKINRRSQNETNVCEPQFTVEGKSLSYAKGSTVPIQTGSPVPPNRIRIGKEKTRDYKNNFFKKSILPKELLKQRQSLIIKKSIE